jgi:23S rRNA (guanine745-N1)-methyltransferase
MDFDFKCPVCGEELVCGDNTLKCINNHNFDIAKQGYVNLLQSQKSSKKRHGDDKLMVKARQQFLDKGYYLCLFNGLAEALGKCLKKDMTIADLGCGECWYTSKTAEFLDSKNINYKICGIDISKYALIQGSKRNKKLNLAVGSTSNVPILDNSCDAVLTVFAPYTESEIFRILKNGGIWIDASPLERHLMELKNVIYDKPYENEVDMKIPEGFSLCDRQEIKDKIIIKSNEDIMNLFMMTPYYYKTGKEDQQKLCGLNLLETEIQFEVRTLSK